MLSDTLKSFTVKIWWTHQSNIFTSMVAASYIIGISFMVAEHVGDYHSMSAMIPGCCATARP